MRIIAGRFKKHKLFFPADNPEVRPTKGIVREAVFSIIGGRLRGENFLDLFAGCGVNGFEALSRGAQEVVFVDTSTYYISKNLKKFKVKALIIKNNTLSAIRWLEKKKKKFKFIYLDPPYFKSIGQRTLAALQNSAILDAQAWIILECSSKTVLPKNIKPFIIKNRKFGNSQVIILQKE